MSEIPEKIGRFEVRAMLGQGGMGTIYRAFDPFVKREVALKLLHTHMQTPDMQARFRREAEVVAALEHPAIVPIYEYEEENGVAYFVLRLMRGGSLMDRLHRGRLSLAEITPIYDRIAAGIDYAHSKGVIHRDLKPANILFDEQGLAYVSDFGIAKLQNASSALTAIGSAIGTPAYMSPEQSSGGTHVDGRSDIYALGAMLFQLLTGEQPYNAPTPIATALKHITEPIPNLRTAAPELPASLEYVNQKALAKQPDQRYQTATELAQALQNANTAAQAPVSHTTEAATLLETPISQPVLPSTRIPQTPPPTAAPVLANTARIAPTNTPPAAHPSAESAPKKSGCWVWGLGIAAGLLLLICIGASIFGKMALDAANASATEDAAIAATAVVAAATEQAQNANAIEATRDSATASAVAVLASERTAIAATSEAERTAEASVTEDIAISQEATATSDVGTNDGNSLISETFNDNHLDWPTGEIDNQYYSGSNAVTGGVYHWEVRSKKSFSTYESPGNNVPLDEFRLQLGYNVVDWSPDLRVGAYVLYDENFGFYLVEVSQTDMWLSVCRLNKAETCEWETLDSVEVTVQSDTNWLTIVHQSNTIDIVFNDTYHLTYEDPEVNAGYAGLSLGISGAEQNAIVDFTQLDVEDLGY